MKSNFQKRAVFAFCLVLTFAGLALRGDDVLSGEDRRLFADGLFNRQLYKQAAKEYARYLEDYPNAEDYDALLCRLGESLRLSGDKEGACKIFFTLAKHKDSKYNTEALLKLASMLLDINDVEKAEQISDSLVKKNPSKDILAEALYLHGSALVRLGRTTDAIADFDRLLRECGTSHYVPYAKVALGSILADSKHEQLPRAEQLLNEAYASKLPAKTLEAECLFYLGHVLCEMQKYREGAAKYLELIQKHPEDTRLNDVYIKLAWSYFRAGMYTDASTIVVDILQSRGGFTNSQLCELRYIAGCSFFEVSNYTKAIEFYESVIKVDPKNVFSSKARYNLARAHYNCANYDKVIEILRPILHDSLLREDAVWLMAEAAMATNNTELAIQNYRIFLNEFPNSEFADDSIYRIGCVYRAAGQREEAAASFLQLTEKYPKSEFAADALFFAALSYSASEDERALGLWKRFVKEHSGDSKIPVATYHIAVEENRRGNVTEALDAFILIYSAYPQSEFAGEACIWAGNLLMVKGELVEAEKTLRKALTYKLSIDLEQKAKYTLAMILQKQNKEEESINMMRGLLDNNVSESFAPQQLDWLSRSLIDRKLWLDAEKAALKLANDLETSPEWKQTGWALAAKAASGAGRFADAETYYKNALNCGAKTREYIECCYFLGELLMQRKNFAEAEERFAEAAKLSADMPEFTELRIYSYIGHGHSAIARGKRKDGIRILSATIYLFYHETLLPPIMKEVIGLLEEEGRMDEANTMREELKTMYPQSEEAKSYAMETK